MKKIFIVLALFITVNLQGQWIQQQSNQTYNLQSAYFIDSLTGFVIGYGYNQSSNIIKTTDGGNNWQITHLLDSNRFIHIVFSDKNTGFISADNGKYFKTTDKGLNWTKYNLGIPSDISQMYFINHDTGYTLVYNSIQATYNGGINWVTISTNFPCPLYQICFTNNKTGYMVGASYNIPNPPAGYIFKTTNGGYNWTTLFVTYTQFRTVIFKDTLNGIASGINDPLSFRTTNGGQNWTSSYMNDFYAWDGKYLSNGKAFLAGSINGTAVVYSSRNGGISWTNELQTGGNYNQFHNIFFVNERIGWVSGTNFIFKTTNGGLTFTESTINVIPDKYFLSQNFPNPFNPTTKISFALPKQGLVTIKVFDVLGKEMETLVNESLKPGTYEAAFDGSNYPSGVYFYRLTVNHGGTSTDGFKETKRMVMIK